MSESAIQKDCIEYIRAIGGYAVRVNSGAMQKKYTPKNGKNAGIEKNYWIALAPEGTPDVFSCINGRFVTIEVKKDKKEYEKWVETENTDRRSNAQHHQQAMIQKAKGITLVVWSLEQLKNDIDELKNNREL